MAEQNYRLQFGEDTPFGFQCKVVLRDLLWTECYATFIIVYSIMNMLMLGLLDLPYSDEPYMSGNPFSTLLS